jgi:hypothetical protein
MDGYAMAGWFGTGSRLGQLLLFPGLHLGLRQHVALAGYPHGRLGGIWVQFREATPP